MKPNKEYKAKRNEWTIYWTLHFIGLAGMVATFTMLPGFLMGVIGGLWMVLFMGAARLFVVFKNNNGV